MSIFQNLDPKILDFCKNLKAGSGTTLSTLPLALDLSSNFFFNLLSIIYNINFIYIIISNIL